ncbi:hypothetical protein L226DRAFT_568588 [Lentinus tigrinus ALCF2SS1-7]|uniref:Uncharacterized protein n=1 Tax=Lentinus tigrinus ALCF2SS1-6 TaxID=1328759 RepID=A0A5C2SMJ5_9APHY|nr:hypothetical protein L227DRAFT_573228 [Lentinus tigrinus ALCF2SS1-6]RPD77530.1 hypothetical protein L226DRAFT_568588 [Lentinus tigrinus ALCF2SS1-7]
MASSVSQDSATTHDQPLAEPVRTPRVVITPVRTHAEGDEHVEGLQEVPLVYDEPPRPQAGPLPRKRGEIGFEEGVDDVPDAESQASSSSLNLPERHPADRDAPPAASSGEGEAAAAPPRSPSRTESTNTANSAGKRSFISFLKPKRIPTYAGLRLTTLAIFAFQLCLFGGTIAGWVLTVKRMQKSTGSSDDQDSSTHTSGFNTTSAQIFVHVAFAIVSLAEGVFLERSVFRLRAERYAHVHPGEILPSARRAEQEVAMGFAPWNRPPLPTYAAALAQSGLGTGDVEDNIIAIPPPPAYGNTRGSTLLLSGFLSEALRAQRPRSAGSRASRNSARSSRSARSGEDEGDRPKSYMSTDPEWEARCDADRALVLEETLARLEDGNGRSRRS